MAIDELQSTRSYEKYLGLSALLRRSKTRTFKSIKDINWKVKFLLQEVKEILLKADIKPSLYIV
jgi:hypothetical protein